ncbi:MAG TPA: hypothetical protein VGN37_27865 [Actinocatenispora sp.]
MATAVDGLRPAAPRTRPVAWVLRAVVTAHLVAIVGQPVFAGVYLSGDFDGLRLHSTGADIVTSVGYVQLAVAVVAAVRLRRSWPLVATAVVVAAETVQYVAGLAGALWLHIPLGVMTVVAVVLLFVATWRADLARREPTARHDAGAEPVRVTVPGREDGNA